MSRYLIILKSICLFAVVLLFSTVSLSASTLEELSEGANYGDALITSGQGKITFDWVRADSTSLRAVQQDKKAKEETPPNKVRVRVNTKRIDLNFAFSGPKVRCDEKSIDLLPTGKTYQRHWQSAFNGEKVDFVQLDGTGINGLVKPKGAIRSDTKILRSDKFDPRYFALSILGAPCGEFLLGTSKDGQLQNIRISGEEALDGIPCTVVEAGVTNADIQYKVWVASGQMYRPKRIEVKTSASLKVIDTVFKHYDGDVWFPEMISVKDYYFDEKTGAPVLEERFTLSINSSFQINTTVPDSVFQIKFPKGLKVYDWRTGATFKAE